VPALNRIPAIRIVAAPAALDALVLPDASLGLRVAADELLVIQSDLTQPGPVRGISDPHAIVEPEGGFAGAWWPAEDAHALLTRACEWGPPAARPAFAQGAIAEVPAKLWLEERRALILVPAPLQADFEERIA
jgi:hypothetical protein